MSKIRSNFSKLVKNLRNVSPTFVLIEGVLRLASYAYPLSKEKQRETVRKIERYTSGGKL